MDVKYGINTHLDCIIWHRLEKKLLAVLKTVICFRPPENPGNFLRSTSNNKVSGLIVSPKYLSVHKPIVAGCAYFTLYPAGICEKKILAQSGRSSSPPKSLLLFVFMEQ